MRLLILFLCASLFADAPFTAKEAMGKARVNESVFCGIALKKGEVTDLGQLSLFRGTTEIPAQFSKLVRFEDGSYQWALCDFTDNYAAGEEKAYTVKKQAPTVSPSTVISVSRAGSVITINNGVLSFQVDTVNFTGIQNAAYNSTPVIGATGGGFSIRDEVTGQTYMNGPVTKARFLYLGPLRAVFRVEGIFYMDTCGGLGYFYEVDVSAGSPRIRMEVQVRNCINAECGRMAKIKRSFIAFPIAYTPTVVAYDTVFITNWGGKFDTADAIRGYQNGSVGVEILERCAGGLYTHFLANQVLNGNTVEVDVIKENENELGYEDSVYKLSDYGTKNSEIFLEFYTGSKSAAQLGSDAFRLKSRMVGRPDPAYLSSTGAFSAGKFGTLEDEVASYTKWGWSFTENQKPSMAAQPDANVGSEDIHYEAETDDAAGMLLQWLRTGSRGYFDIGEAWARYYKTWYAFRSIGWEHDGQGTVYSNIYWCATPGANFCQRRTQTVGGEPGYWTNWGTSRVDVVAWVGCHFFGEGTLDYYCLTGDIDALEGAQDLGESAWLGSNDKSRGDTLNSSNHGDRATGRQLLHLMRLYEVMRDSASFYRANLRAKMVLRSKHIDPRGFLFDYISDGTWFGRMTSQSGFPDSLKQYLTANNITLQTSGDTTFVVKGADRWPIHNQWGSWEQTYVQAGIDRFYQATGDEDARDYVIGFGEHGARDMTVKCGFVPYIILFDFPEKDCRFGYYSEYMDFDPAHNACVNNQSTVEGSLPTHEGWYTVYYPNVCALGYRYTGKASLLRKAYSLWNLGSKRGYQSDYFYKPEDEVNWFAYHWPVKDDGLMNTNKLFYETMNHGDTVPPQAINDLSVGRLEGNTGLVFAWTAPADNNGRVVEYQLKYYKGKTIVDYEDYSYRTTDSVNVPFWYAKNAPGEPAPQAAGNPESYSLTRLFPTNEVWYAGICSRDSSGNLSPLSNVVRIDNTISVEDADGALKPLMLSAAPNPFNPSVRLAFYPGRRAMDDVRMSVVNIAGQVLKEYVFDRVMPGKGVTVVWNGENNGNRVSASGVYVVRVKCGNLALVKKIVMAK